MSYHRPHSLADALALRAAGPMTVAAGCTDLFPATAAPEIAGPILDLTAVEGLRGIERTGAGWQIGAATSWSDILRADLPPVFDGLKQAAREVGSVQIQNAGTLAGNLCTASPAADGVPCLLVLDASVALTSLRGTRRMPLADFLAGPRRTALQPDEIVTAIHIPDLAGRSAFRKLGARRYLVISIAMVSVRLVVDAGLVRQAAIAVGACSPVARRLPALESRLVGVPLAEASAQATPETVGACLDPIDDIRASAAYRRHAATVLVSRILADVAR